MTIEAGPPQAVFRISDLVYDTRYRSLTIQTFAFVAIMAVIVWLGFNVAENLDALGRGISFSFLWSPAGYDIGQTLIPYASTDTHARAALVGIINTILVAVMGCMLATLLGVIIGILRLSKNWIVARLMLVYVEVFRNVPILFWILAIFFGIFIDLPPASVFREGGNGQMVFFGSTAFTNRGVYIPWPQFAAASWGMAAVFAGSVAGAFWWRARAKRLLFDDGRMVPVFWPVVAILVLPVVLSYFVFGQPISLTYPVMARFNFEGGGQISNAFLALWLALSLYTAAYIAEIVRSGIEAVPRGQTEAAAALGMRPDRIMNLVILPQAMRVIVPPLISQYLNLTKNSSLALATGYMDVRNTLGGITMNQTGKELEAMLLVGLFYLILSLLISAAMNVVNSRVKLKER